MRLSLRNLQMVLAVCGAILLSAVGIAVAKEQPTFGAVSERTLASAQEQCTTEETEQTFFVSCGGFF